MATLLGLEDSEDATCPQTFNCTNGTHSFDIGKTPSYVAIVSSALSCLGSILIFIAFLTLRDLRTAAQKIITFLALADFISAAGYIVGSSNFIEHFNENDTDKCRVFKTICVVQASITSWSSLVSFAWTLILAFYFYMVIVYNRKTLATKLMPLYHFLAWVVPLFIIVPLIATEKLGYAPYAASNWCYVKGKQNTTERPDSLPLKDILIILVAGKFWEISTYICVIVAYTHIVCRISKLKRKRRDYLPAQAVNVMEQAEKRLIYIPIFFIILRMWGTVQFFVSIVLRSQEQTGCVTRAVLGVFFSLGILQAIGDPGQGWGNAILYVFLSPVVRQRLWNRISTCSLVLCLQTAMNIPAAGSHDSARVTGSSVHSSRGGRANGKDGTRGSDEEATILSLNERPREDTYGSTSSTVHKDVHINPS